MLHRSVLFTASVAAIFAYDATVMTVHFANAKRIAEVSVSGWDNAVPPYPENFEAKGKMNAWNAYQVSGVASNPICRPSVCLNPTFASCAVGVEYSDGCTCNETECDCGETCPADVCQVDQEARTVGNCDSGFEVIQLAWEPTCMVVEKKITRGDTTGTFVASCGPITSGAHGYIESNAEIGDVTCKGYFDGSDTDNALDDIAYSIPCNFIALGECGCYSRTENMDQYGFPFTDLDGNEVPANEAFKCAKKDSLAKRTKACPILCYDGLKDKSDIDTKDELPIQEQGRSVCRALRKVAKKFHGAAKKSAYEWFNGNNFLDFEAFQGQGACGSLGEPCELGPGEVSVNMIKR